MADRFCAQITIGGRLPHGRLPKLLKAVAESGGSLEWGDAPFRPASADALHSALRDGRLVLCDDQATNGEFERLEAACRVLRLSYTRWAEGKYEHDAELVDWRPGMREPRVRVGSNAHPQQTVVPADRVRTALSCLESGSNPRAIRILRSLCPEIPDLPPLEIVKEDDHDAG